MKPRGPNAYQGDGEQPPVNGTGIVLATLAILGIWLAMVMIMAVWRFAL